MGMEGSESEMERLVLVVTESREALKGKSDGIAKRGQMSEGKLDGAEEGEEVSDGIEESCEFKAEGGVRAASVFLYGWNL